MMRYLLILMLFVGATLHAAIEIDVTYLQQQLAQDPKNVPYRLILARYYLQNGALKKAEKMLDQIRSIDPKNAKAQTLQKELDRLQKLQNLLPSATLNDPFEVEKALSKIEECPRQLQAYTLLKEAHLPLDSEIHLDAALCYARTGRFKNARLLREVHTFTPSAKKEALDALLALSRNDLEQAQRHADTLAQTNPNVPLTQLVQKKIAQKRAVLAHTAHQKAFGEHSMQALNDYVYLLSQQKEPQKAIDAVREYIRKNPKNREAKILLAKLYYWNGNLERAFHTLYPVRLTNMETRTLYANILYEKGDYTHALVYLPQASKAAKDPKERYNLQKRTAFAWAYIGHDEKANRLFRKLLAQHPDDTEIRNFTQRRSVDSMLQKAIAAHRAKSYDSALTWYTRYYEKTKDPKIAKEIAEINYLKERYREALPWFERYLATTQKDPLVRFHYATALEKRKRYRESIPHFNRVAEESEGELRYLARYHEAHARMQTQEEREWYRAREELKVLNDTLAQTPSTQFTSLKKYVASLCKTAQGPVLKPTYFKDIVLTEGAKKDLNERTVFSNLEFHSTTRPSLKTLLHITPHRNTKPHLELHADYADDAQTRYLNYRIKVANLMAVNGIRYSAAARRFNLDFHGRGKENGKGFALEVQKGTLSLSLGVTQFEEYNMLEPRLTWAPVYGSHTLYMELAWQNGIFQNYRKCMLTGHTGVLHAALYDRILMENLDHTEIGISINAYEDKNINLNAMLDYPFYTVTAWGIKHTFALNENIEYNSKTDLCYSPSRFYDTTYLKYRPKMDFDNGSLRLSLGSGYAFNSGEGVTSYGLESTYTLHGLATLELNCEQTQSSFTTEDIKYCNFNIIQEW